MDIEFTDDGYEAYALITIHYYGIEIAIKIYDKENLDALKISNGQLESQTWVLSRWNPEVCIIIGDNNIEFRNNETYLKLPRNPLVDSEIIRLRDTLAEYTDPFGYYKLDF